jgi:hypothetical protein
VYNEYIEYEEEEEEEGPEEQDERKPIERGAGLRVRTSRAMDDVRCSLLFCLLHIFGIHPSRTINLPSNG